MSDIDWKEQNVFSYKFWYAIARFFMRLRNPMSFRGRENIPAGGCLVCANHTHLTDPLIVGFALTNKNRLRFMAKAELFERPLAGSLLRSVGAFPVKRGQSDMAALKLAISCLEHGDKLVMFPQGTRVAPGESAEVKTGAAMLALRTGVPVLPIYIQSPSKRFFHRIRVVIGKPYLPDLGGEKPNRRFYPEVAAEIMSRINALEDDAQ